jgi:hypothetical protein
MSIDAVLKTGDEDKKNQNPYDSLQIVTPHSFQHRFAFPYPIPLLPLPKIYYISLFDELGQKKRSREQTGGSGQMK